jgi:glycosyltransferase involved in cell wall biosynthesis
MQKKLARHDDWAGLPQVSFVWSRRRETIWIGNNLVIESLPAFLGSIRIVYDIASVCVIPYMLFRNKIRPTAIVVQEFPLVWAAYAAHLFVGGEVTMRLTNLSSELAQTRGRLNYLYHRAHELLGSRLVARYLVINETTKLYIEQLGVSEKRISVSIPHTIRDDMRYIRGVRKGSVRATLGIPADASMILAVGRLEKEKAFDELIDVFVKSRVGGYLVIVGKGKLRESLQARIRSHGAEEKILLVGRKDRSELWNYYADADVFVLLSRSEALGLVFWEAMYMNVPVIGRPTGGIVETIGKDGERGFFWDTPDGPAVFAAKIARCLNREEIDAMVQRARQHVERITRSKN